MSATNGRDLDSIVDRLRELAAVAAATKQVAEPAPHPDAELLELCTSVLDARAQHDAIDREARKLQSAYRGNPAFDAAMSQRDAMIAKWRSPLIRISRTPAKTAAGVYAKAHILINWFSPSPYLARSLAEDLVNCPGLRSAIWPAEGAE